MPGITYVGLGRPALSLIDDALNRHEVMYVAPNQVSFVTFYGNIPLKAIGTSELNGGFAVAIVSRWAAILAHISSLPSGSRSEDIQAGLSNLRARMDNFMGQYYEFWQLLPQSVSKVYVMVPICMGEVALPGHLDDILNILAHNELPRPEAVEYVVRRGNYDPAYGTMFIDGREGGPVVYVEDQQVPEL